MLNWASHLGYYLLSSKLRQHHLVWHFHLHLETTLYSRGLLSQGHSTFQEKLAWAKGKVICPSSEECKGASLSLELPCGTDRHLCWVCWHLLSPCPPCWPESAPKDSLPCRNLHGRFCFLGHTSSSNWLLSPHITQLPPISVITNFLHSDGNYLARMRRKQEIQHMQETHWGVY